MTTGQTQRIMVVDDDASIRRTLQILLSKAGYEVMQAGDGLEAVRLWRDRGGDLVITDLHMPEKDGIETIIELLSHSPGIRIIAMSGGGQTKRLDLLGNATLLGVLTIEATGDLTIKGASITVQSSGAVQVSGASISLG